MDTWSNHFKPGGEGCWPDVHRKGARLSYRLYHGKAPAVIHWTCGNYACIRPDHLGAGPAPKPSEVKRAQREAGREAGRQRVEQKSAERMARVGAAPTGRRAVFDGIAADYLVRMIQEGKTQAEIAEHFGCHRTTVANARRSLVAQGRIKLVEERPRKRGANISRLDAIKMIRRMEEGERPSDLAKEFGVSVEAVYHIRAGKRHTDIERGRMPHIKPGRKGIIRKEGPYKGMPTLTAVQLLAKAGHSAEEAAAELGISMSTAYHNSDGLFRENLSSLAGTKGDTAERLLLAGATTSDVAEVLGVTRKAVWEFARRREIRPETDSIFNREAVLAMVESGSPVEDVAMEIARLRSQEPKAAVGKPSLKGVDAETAERMLRAGVRPSYIARLFGVSPQTITRLKQKCGLA